MTANKPMTGEQLDELMTLAVNMQRDAEIDKNQPSAHFAYAVQVAVLQMRKLQDALEAAEKRNAELCHRLHAYTMTPGQADQRMCESRAVREALGFEIDADDVAPIDLRQRITELQSRAESAEQALNRRSAPVGDLVMLIKVLVRALIKTGMKNELCERATAYLQREQLISASDCLRDNAAGLQIQGGE